MTNNYIEYSKLPIYRKHVCIIRMTFGIMKCFEQKNGNRITSYDYN